jgi:DNA-binding response OmpR family regulator
MQALQEVAGFEASDEKSADITIKKSQLPNPPYRIGEIIDLITSPAKKITIQGVEFDLSKKTARSGENKISLTEKEAEIIGILSQAKKPVGRDELLQKIWQYAPDATTNPVETHIYRLRQKLSDNFGIEVIDGASGNYFIKNG